MTLSNAIAEARRVGRGFARRAIIGTTELLAFNGWMSVANIDDLRLSVADAMADDYVIEPVRNLTVSEAVLIEQWNASLPSGSPDANKAPGSPRYQRFLSGLRGAQRG